MPEGFKAELIQGRVYVPSPVRRWHGRPHSLVSGWLSQCEVATPGEELLHGGQTGLDEDDYVIGPPELVVEVAARTEAYDLFEKREVYQQTGVQEYLIVIVRTQEIRWLQSTDSYYEEQQATSEGVFHSQVFPGLWLDPKALLAEELPRLIETLKLGLASPEHAEFVRQLEERKKN